MQTNEAEEPDYEGPGRSAPVVPANHSTEPKYVEWLAEWRKHNNQKNACYSAARAAVDAFPELTLCRGWALYQLDLEWVKGYECWSQHWWCEAPDGTIVDPTAEQWMEPRGGVVTGYEKYDPKFHGPEPIGKCMCCGFLIYRGDYDSTSFCSEDCEKDARAYYT